MPLLSKLARFAASPQGKRLAVELEPLRKLTKDEREALAAEAERLAPFRGAQTAELVLA